MKDPGKRALQGTPEPLTLLVQSRSQKVGRSLSSLLLLLLLVLLLLLLSLSCGVCWLGSSVRGGLPPHIHVPTFRVTLSQLKLLEHRAYGDIQGLCRGLMSFLLWIARQEILYQVPCLARKLPQQPTKPSQISPFESPCETSQRAEVEGCEQAGEWEHALSLLPRAWRIPQTPRHVNPLGGLGYRVLGFWAYVP